MSHLKDMTHVFHLLEDHRAVSPVTLYFVFCLYISFHFLKALQHFLQQDDVSHGRDLTPLCLKDLENVLTSVRTKKIQKIGCDACPVCQEDAISALS